MSSQVFPAPAFVADFPPVVGSPYAPRSEIWVQLTKIFSQIRYRKIPGEHIKETEG